MGCNEEFVSDPQLDPERAQGCSESSGEWPFSRRDFVLGATATAGAAALSPGFAQSGRDLSVKRLPLTVTINGESKRLEVDPRMSLLDLLRENLHLTGTKKGCDHGQCGACTVLMDGRRINSCLTLAITCEGEKITTIEGLAKDGDLSPMQQAFLDNDGYQCGYCTPGQIISAVALLDEARKGAGSFVTPNLRVAGHLELTDAEIRERMSGNICRCGAYPGIVAAVRQAYESAGTITGQKRKGDTDAAI